MRRLESGNSRRDGGEKRGMTAILWREAAREGSIPFEFRNRGHRKRFWQNETNRESFGKTKPTKF
jgi:hypothetical protein